MSTLLSLKPQESIRPTDNEIWHTFSNTFCGWLSPQGSWDPAWLKKIDKTLEHVNTISENIEKVEIIISFTQEMQKA